MATRKYMSETALNLHTSTAIMLPPDQLRGNLSVPEHAAKALEECHIYVIATRPALSFDPASFEFAEDKSTGHFVRRVAGEIERFPFADRLGVPPGGRVVVAPYPHRELRALDKDGNSAERFWPANILVQRAAIDAPELIDFKVQYVGQAFADGKRSAFERLKSHSTLQRILADMAAKQPDDEVMLFLFKYEPAVLHTSIDGTTPAEISGEEDSAHWRSLVDNPPSEKEEIGLAEAALIRYFEPEYNEIYKESFPAQNLKVLENCYNMDFVGLTVEINTEDLRARLWSDRWSKGFHHIASFDLHDPDVRRGFMTLTNPKTGKLVAVDISGPAF